MRRFGMVLSPAALFAAGFFLVLKGGGTLLFFTGLAWLLIEGFVALRQEYRSEVPRRAWISASRLLWLGSVVFFSLDAQRGWLVVKIPDPVSAAVPVLIGLGLVLRLAAAVQLGRFFTYDIRLADNHRLMTGGVYGRIRHPAYLAVCLLGTLPALLAGSVAGFGLLVLATLPQTLYRISIEEKMLEQRFGAEFLAYKTRSWRLIPFLY